MTNFKQLTATSAKSFSNTEFHYAEVESKGQDFIVNFTMTNDGFDVVVERGDGEGDIISEFETDSLEAAKEKARSEIKAAH